MRAQVVLVPLTLRGGERSMSAPEVCVGTAIGLACMSGPAAPVVAAIAVAAFVVAAIAVSQSDKAKG